MRLETVLYEVAFYSFYFLSAMEVPYKKDIILNKTSFATTLKTSHFLDLTSEDFVNSHKKIAHKTHYSYLQDLGEKMRDNHVEAFAYFSARAPAGLAVFNISALDHRIKQVKQWQIKQNTQTLIFTCPLNKQYAIDITKEHFLVEGVFPNPVT